MVIAVDGPSGVGKSTVSRAVAAALGIAYLDTGSYYRAATYLALHAGADPDDPDEILAALANGDLTVTDGQLRIGSDDVSDLLRGPEVTAAVSTVAAHAAVRARIVDMQRAWVAAHGGDAVVEGRDIGTVVFPDAALKVFLTADPAVRAARRAGDAEAGGIELESLRAELAERDRADSSREVSPMVPAADALIIDTSTSTVEQVVARILSLLEDTPDGPGAATR